MTTGLVGAAAMGDELLAEADAFLGEHLLPGLAVGVVRGQDLIWSAGLGFTDLETKRPIDSGTLFQIASVTKTFTATAILQLRDRALLRLDDPLETYVPEFKAVEAAPGVSGEVTLRHLLQHASGLQGETPHSDPRQSPNITQAEVISSLGRTRILTRPGTAFRYSNMGYRLLAEVVFRVGGERWPDHARRQLLEPLGMLSSGSFPADAAWERRAQGHLRGRFEDRPFPVPAVDSALAEGDGDLWSSVDDLARWVAFQLGASTRSTSTRVLADASLLEMHQPTLVASSDWTEVRCLGWGAVRRDWGQLLCHGGLLDGYNSHACFSGAEQLGVVAFTNGLPRTSVGDLAWNLMDRMVVAERALRPAATRGVDEPVPAVPDRWREHLGRYADPIDGEELLIEHQDGKLVCTDAIRSPATPLVPTDDPSIFHADLEEWRFLRGPTGAIDGLNVRGYPFVKVGS